jgi:large subunit ribosomal protein L29
MNTTEIMDFSDEKLVHTELQMERELIAARFRHYTSQLEDNSVLKGLRRNIARLQTAVRQREIAQDLLCETFMPPALSRKQERVPVWWKALATSSRASLTRLRRANRRVFSLQGEGTAPSRCQAL